MSFAKLFHWLKHDWNKWEEKETANAVCYVGQTRTCKICNFTQYRVDKKPHQWGKWQQRAEEWTSFVPEFSHEHTFMKTVQIRSCSVCNLTEKEYFDEEGECS